jgi:hypothetical protein
MKLNRTLIVAGGVTLSMGSALRAGGIAGPAGIAGACLAWAIDNNLTRKVSITHFPDVHHRHDH